MDGGNKKAKNSKTMIKTLFQLQGCAKTPQNYNYASNYINKIFVLSRVHCSHINCYRMDVQQLHPRLYIDFFYCLERSTNVIKAGLEIL